MWFVLMIICLAAVEFWQLTVTIIVICATVKIGQYVQAGIVTRRAAEAARVQGLIDRATREHEQIQKGRIDGVYGSYPVPKECRGLGIWLAD